METDRREAVAHIREHIGFPATRDEILQRCNNLECSPKDADWLRGSLPARSYASAEEALYALRLL